MNKTNLALCGILLCAGVFFYCSKPEGPSAGNSSRTPNAFVQGRLLDATGAPATGALVRIYPADYIPSFSGGTRLGYQWLQRMRKAFTG